MKKTTRKIIITLIIVSLAISGCYTFSEKNALAKKSSSKEEYKKKCNRKYHDGLFFTKKNLEGKYVKVKCFLSQEMYFEVPTSFTQKNGIERIFFYAKPQRKGEKSYASGGDISLYFTKKSKCKSSKYKLGDYVYVYGKIISFSNKTWTGYNDIGIEVKYMEKTKN